MSFFKPSFLTIDPKYPKSFVQGAWMWFLLFLGYALFCANWFLFGNKLMGNESVGWISGNNFKWLQEKKIIQQFVSYAIIFGRAIAFLTTAWIVKKFTHRYSVLLALFLNAFAFILVWMRYYSLMVFGRLMMAFGGSLIIIYIQPIINKFFFPNKQKIFSIFSAAAYPIAEIVICLMFLHTGATTFFQTHWFGVALFFGSLSFIPLILYIFVGVNFDVSDTTKTKIAKNQKTSMQYFREILSSRDSWVFFVFYSFLVFVSVCMSWKVPEVAKKLNPDLTQDLLGGQIKWDSLYVVFFYLGCIAGMSLGIFVKRRMQRRPVLIVSTLLTFVFSTIIILCIVSQLSGMLVNLVIFISIFFVSFFGMGLQTVSFYMPHEKNEKDAIKITTFFSIMWSVGYALVGIYAIAWDILNVMLGQVGGRCALLIAFLLMAAYFGCSFLIKETKPEWPVFSMKKIEDYQNEQSKKIK